MSKVLFLDVDGVLNGDRDYSVDHRFPLNPGSMSLLRGILDETGCKVVISSTWRKLPDAVAVLLSTPYLTVDDLYLSDFSTPVLHNQPRGREIEQWLLMHPDVDSYVIVDDSGDMLPYQRNRFVQTKGTIGMTMNDAQTIAEKFYASNS